MRGSGKAAKMARGHFVWQKVAKNQGHMGAFNLNSTVLGKQWCFNWFSGCVHVHSYKNCKSGCGQSGIIASIVAYRRLV